MGKEIGLICALASLCSRILDCHGFVLRHRLVGIRGRFATTPLTAGSADDDKGASILLGQDRFLTARRLVSEGMEAFRAGNIKQSIELFDQAEATQGPSLTPFLWQRGISYYYDDDFESASRQFRTDVRVNPSDVEEIVWDIASQLRLQGPDNAAFPVPNQLALPPGTRDRRRIMVRDDICHAEHWMSVVEIIV